MKNIEKKNIRSLSLDDLKFFFVKNEEKSYRANQVYEWLWKRGVLDFGKMTNLSRKAIELLKDFEKKDEPLKTNEPLKTSE